MKNLLNPVAVGEAIRILRERARMGAGDLAAQAGMTSSTLSRTENGLRAVELAEAVSIVETVGSPLQTLVDLARDPKVAALIQARQKVVADLQQSKADIKKAADQALDELKAQLGQ